MKFNKMTLYKVPFDNSYSNVIDYRLYQKSGVGLIEQSPTAANIIKSRDYYFNSLTSFEFLMSSFKSIKFNDNIGNISVALDYLEICNYNYVVFENTLDDPAPSPNKLYCFITSFTSNNNGQNPSTSIYVEIDYWTMYITSILLGLHDQYEEYGHILTGASNPVTDDRLPQEFLYKHSYTPFKSDKVIVWMELKFDNSTYPWDKYDMPSSGLNWATIIQLANSVNGADTAYKTVYLPFGVVEMVNETLSFSLIKGIYNKDFETGEPLVNVEYDKYLNYSNLLDPINTSTISAFDSQYIIECNLTTITPFGMLDYNTYCKTDGYGDIYFVVDQVLEQESVKFEPESGTDRTDACTLSKVRINNIEYYFTTMPLYSTTKNCVLIAYGLFGCYNINNLPTDNTVVSKTLSKTITTDNHINTSYDPDKEIKLLSNPFTKYYLMINGKEIDISMNAGTGSILSLTISLRELFSIIMRIESNLTDNHDTTFFTPIGNTGAFITGVNKYSTYSETRQNGDYQIMTANAIKGFVGGAIGFGMFVGGLASENPMLVAKGVQQTFSGPLDASNAIIKYENNIYALKHTAADYVIPSTNAIDHIFDTLPIIDERTLNSRDKNAVADIWNKYGYPVKELIPFETKRFWHDYKKISNPQLQNITNPMARVKISQILSNGVQIWHHNAFYTSSPSTIEGQYISRIGDYSKNNPNKGSVLL